MSENAQDELVDYITGEKVPNIGAEENRQAFEKHLIDVKGYLASDIVLGKPLKLTINGEPYNSRIELVICIGGKSLIAVKFAPGSLGSRDREIIAASRIAEEYQIPYSVVSDGITAIVMDTVTGKKVGDGLDAVPSKDELVKLAEKIELIPYPADKLEKAKIVFRSYDSLNVNVI